MYFFQNDVNLPFLLLVIFKISLTSCKLEAEMLSWYPLITLFPNFLSDKECDFIIEQTKRHPRYIASKSEKSISVYFDDYPHLNEALKDIGKLIREHIILAIIILEIII